MKDFKIKKDLVAILFLLFVNCLLFFKIFLSGLYPVPGDLLVSFYYPWYSGQWQGYDPWTTRKELLSADAIRQIYIWKDFAATSFKSGQLPLWNPYTFSGQPLLANVQSSVFYPLNIFYFLFNSKVAWVLLVVSQPILASIFCYLFCRSLKISRIGSAFSASAFIFTSYIITWLENVNIISSYLFLPVVLLACQKFYQNHKSRYIALGAVGLSLSVLAGHPQTAIYIYITFAAFWLFKWFFQERQGKNLMALGQILLLSVGLSAIQIFPTVAFYKQSPVSLEFAKQVFDEFLIPYQNLITFLAPDFFGHPATNNFWSRNYGDFNPYIGVIPLVLAAVGIYKNRSNQFIKFGLVVGVLFLLASVASPVSFLVKVLELPVLDSTSSARFMSITLFILIVFAGFGLDSFVQSFKKAKKSRPIFLIVLSFGLIYFALWLLSGYFKYIPGIDPIVKANYSVTQRNLLLPTFLYSIIFLPVLFWYFFSKKFKYRKVFLNIFLVALFGGTIFGGLYFSNKYLPSAPLSFIFPQHKLFDYFSTHAGIYRIEGFGTAYIDRNFPAVYKLYGVEGYDTLRLKRYAELMASSEKGRIPKLYPRSDAILPPKENEYRMRLMELLGVKYLADKEDDPKTGADWHYERFTPDKLKGVWQDGKFQVYERENVLPRFFTTNRYEVVTSDDKIIERIYDKKTDLKTLILEEEPLLKIDKDLKSSQQVKLIKYQPNEAVFEVNSNANTLFFLSDSFDPDWQVFTNGSQTKLLRAHYALRAVAVPAGKSEIRFIYAPKSASLGVLASTISLVLLAVVSLVAAKKKAF